jgi:dihydrofolate reductase
MGHGGERLVAWYAGGDTDYRLPGTDMVFKVSAPTAEFLRETRETTGALVFGRETFDLTHGWGGNHPLDVPVFVVSSSVPQAWVSEGSPFPFVTDGLESALEQAQAVAGDKDVGVGAASIVQQCIRAGLLDEIHLDLVPVLLGGGVGLFDHLGTGPIDLERTRVIEGAGVTHLTFRVYGHREARPEDQRAPAWRRRSQAQPEGETRPRGPLPRWQAATCGAADSRRYIGQIVHGWSAGALLRRWGMWTSKSSWIDIQGDIKLEILVRIKEGASGFMAFAMCP